MPTRPGGVARLALAVILLTAILFGRSSTPPVAASAQTDIHGPAGSGKFGQKVAVLPNGNIVVTDPAYTAPGPAAAAGAVYLYNGATGALISALTGSTAGDQVGSGGVTVLYNGNFLVFSPGWHNGASVGAGAVTWGDAASGVSGVISSANSLVGSKTSDQVGVCVSSSCVTLLYSGNYVVVSSDWNGNAGAVTWVNSATGVSGAISAANSLVGSTAGDQTGAGGVTALSSGNYVVISPNWHNGASVANAGAVTWGNGANGVKGTISSGNSLVGSTAGDQVGSGGMTVLNNGSYVVTSPHWHNGLSAGAARGGRRRGGNLGQRRRGHPGCSIHIQQPGRCHGERPGSDRVASRCSTTAATWCRVPIGTTALRPQTPAR